jgi:hypothetical protein
MIVLLSSQKSHITKTVKIEIITDISQGLFSSILVHVHTCINEIKVRWHGWLT